MPIEKHEELNQRSRTVPPETSKPANRLSPQTEASVREAWSEDEYVLNGKKIETLGVGHNPATFEIPEYKQKIESLIGRSSVVLLEFAPSTERSYSLMELKNLVKSLKLREDLTDEELEKIIFHNLFKNPNVEFYRKIQNMAAARNTKIATADPDKNFYEGFLLKKREKEVQSGKSLLRVASLFTLGTWMGVSGLMRLLENARKIQESKETSEKKMSRRDFLKLIGLTAAGAGIANEASILASDYRMKDLAKNRVKNPLGVFLYDALDYRDAAVAEGLDWLSKKDLGEGPIGLIYGSAHTDAIRHYALSPMERKAKLAAYRPYKAASAPGGKVFEFDGEWKLVEKK